MKILRNKSKVYTVALVLVLTITATFVALPIVTAHDPPWEVPTWTYFALSCPNPIGVGQQAVFIFWCNSVPPTAVGAYGDRWTFTVEVTKPDGSKTTLGPFTSDPIGGGWGLYTPDQTGTYSFVAKMAEHTITGLPVPPGGYFPGGAEAINDTYLASASDPVTLIVQEDPIERWTETPLPTEYWTRPINTMNREWYRLAGNWLSGAAQVNGPTTDFGYGPGPESAHIMWATPMWAGGIMDERFGSTGFQTVHYEGLYFTPPIVLNGKIYYNIMSLPREGYRVLDLYTGEELWFKNSSGPVVNVGGGFDFSGELAIGRLAFGQIYDYESPNQHGGFPYLWSIDPGYDTWRMYDAETGNYMCSINNVPTGIGFFGVSTWGTMVYGKDGSILMYNIVGTPNPMGPFFPDVPPFYLQCWNTSRAIWYEDVWLSNEYWMWRPVLNETFDGNNGYSLNVSIPTLPGGILAIREGEFVIGGTAGSNDETGLVPGNLWALSLEKGQEGTLLWNRTFTPPYDPVPPAVGGLFGAGQMMLSAVVPEYDVFLFESSITRERWGYDLTTGQKLWGPTDPEPQMNYYSMDEKIYDGKLLSYGYGGVLIAYDIRTGDVLWNYTASQIGWESPYGNYPMGISCIADGKIYIHAGEHSPTQPLWRGPLLRCIDAETGEELWKISAFGGDMPMGNAGSRAVVADGYLLHLNHYDNQIYCYGKGPSATTVTASPKTIAKGSSALIEGTVTDQSPGAKGTPCVSDASMSAWMEYLYMQQPCPADVTGVPVKLEVFGEDGSYIEIGTVTSDPYGNFKYAWTPPDEQLYTVMATFEGSKSYYSSYAATGLSVGPAPEAPVEEEAEEADYTPLFMAIIAAVAIAIIIGIVNLYALRKR